MPIDPLDFEKKYALVASTQTFSQEETCLRRCRFCNGDEFTTTFISNPHAFSEFLGTNDLIAWEECDDCNKTFSKYESHLSKYFQPFITWNGINGKNGVPTFQARSINHDPDSQTKFSFTAPYHYTFTIGASEDYKINKLEKTFSIKFRIPSHRPIFVYKALVKIALSLLPAKKVQCYSGIYDWLMDRCDNPNILYHAFITVMKRKRFARSHAELYEVRPESASDGILPQLTMVIRFGNIIVQIFLPFTDDYLNQYQPGKNLEINLSPAHLFNNDFEKVAASGKVNYKFEALDLSSADPTTRDQIMHFTYQELQENSTL